MVLGELIVLKFDWPARDQFGRLLAYVSSQKESSLVSWGSGLTKNRRGRSAGSMETLNNGEKKSVALKETLKGVKTLEEEAFTLLCAVPRRHLVGIVYYLSGLNGFDHDLGTKPRPKIRKPHPELRRSAWGQLSARG